MKRLALSVSLTLSLLGCGPSDKEEKPKGPKRGIRVEAPEGMEWAGAFSEDIGSTVSRSGIGPEVIAFPNAGVAGEIQGATIQKQSKGDWELKVVCFMVGRDREEGSTTVEYGVVSVACK